MRGRGIRSPADEDGRRLSPVLGGGHGAPGTNQGVEGTARFFARGHQGDARSGRREDADPGGVAEGGRRFGESAGDAQGEGTDETPDRPHRPEDVEDVGDAEPTGRATGKV